MADVDRVARNLRDLGVREVFGRSIPGLDHVEVEDAKLATLLADAAGRLGPTPGAALLPDGRLHLSRGPGRLSPMPRPVGTPRMVPEMHGRLVVLAGPEVLHAGRVDDLRAFAAAGNLPVANTWGAKGVFAWDSPHHMGTCGLQERDFELLGFGAYDAIVATGIDPDESPVERFGLALVVEVPPQELRDAIRQVEPAPREIRPNGLYDRVGAVAQPGYVDERVPLHPARAVADLRTVLPPGGVLAADPGLAGLWLARTFPTTEPGSVIVPATVATGIGVAIALVAVLRGRPAIAVTVEPLDRATRDVLALAAELGAPLTLDVWGAGLLQSADEHRERLVAAAAAPAVSIVDVPVDVSLTDLLIEAAGPVVAWGGSLI